MSMSQFQCLSWVQKDVAVGLRKMGTEQERQVLRAETVLAPFFQNDEPEHHLFFRMSLDSKLSSGYVN